MSDNKEIVDKIIVCSLIKSYVGCKIIRQGKWEDHMIKTEAEHNVAPFPW